MLNALLPLNEYSIDNIYFQQTSTYTPINQHQHQHQHQIQLHQQQQRRNINEIDFIKILYSTSYFSLIGVHIYIPNTYFNIINKYHTSGHFTFAIQIKENLAQKLYKIEMDILNKFTITDKLPQYTLKNFLENNTIYIFGKSHKCSSILFKISGIYEHKLHYGLSYKFTPLSG